MPPAVEHDSSRFDRRGWISPPDGEEEEEEEEKNAPVITRLRDDQKEACRYLQPRARGTDRAATRSIVPLLSRTGEPQPSAEQFSFFKQRQYVGSWVTALARNSYTHGRRRRCGGKEGGRGEGDGVVCRRYRVKFSAEYKGPSRAWPKAGFTALLVNLAVCAYIFKTHFDPTRLEGIALSETILYLFLPPPPVPSSPRVTYVTLPFLFPSPSPGWLLLLPFHTRKGRGGTRPQRIRCCWRHFSRTCSLPFLRQAFLRRKGCCRLCQLLPPKVFPLPFAPLGPTTRPTRPN